MLNLDFTIPTSEGRKAFVDNYIIDKNFTQTELETIANYILYGKDADLGTSAVDRKEIQIKTKYNSYRKKEPESLDSLLESPTFDEKEFITEKNHYKTIKPKIDREKDKWIPGIQQLWESIDRLQYILDVNLGKKEDSTIKKLNNLSLYKLKHQIIDLRRQQFYLKDIANPTICMFGTSARHNNEKIDQSIPWDFEGSDYSIAPLGLLLGDKDEKFYSPKTYRGPHKDYNPAAKFILDFRNPLHIYYLLENYENLAISAENNPESTVNFILKTLDFYVNFSDLTPIKKYILEMKKLKVSNDNIKEGLEKNFNTSHSSNYISTIWKQKICGEIADAVKLHYDYFLNRYNDFAWKKCSQCGKYKLKDTREYMRKSRSSDGLASKCKKCDKENRDKAKRRQAE